MPRTKAQNYPRVRRRVNPGKTVSWVVDLSKKVPRERLFFKTKEEAEIVAAQKRIEYQNFGASLEEMPETARAEASRLWKQLRDMGSTLTEAVGYFVKHARPAAGEKLVADVIEEMRAKRQENGHSAGYLQVQRSVLGTFAKQFGGQKIHTISSGEIEAWISGNPHWKPRTRLNYQRDLSTLWNFAIRRKYASQNPLEAIDAPMIPNEPPGILTVKQATELLELARQERGGEMMAAVAIGLFAGLRPAEIERLAWSEIDLTSRLIEVTAKKAKTRQRRHVAISDNLAAWLRKVKSRTGSVAPAGPIHEKIVPMAKKVGIAPWPHDALRHSFASYHLAKHKDAARTALELGHGNQDMLFRHYRELVKPASAAEYWSIRPEWARGRSRS